MDETLSTEIVRQINALQAKGNKPVVVRMHEATWERIRSEMKVDGLTLFGLRVMIDPSLAPNWVQVMLAWT